MSKRKNESAGEQPTFEESLAELEQIVTKLEGGKLTLDDALAAYELGVKRLGACYQMLRSAEQRIALVQAVDAQGRVTAAAYEAGANSDDLAEKTASRSRRRTAALPDAGELVDDGSSLF